MKNIPFQTQIWKEGKMYVSYALQLDVSSCGHTIEEARKNIRDAVEGFLEAAQDKGTLKQILEEAGYTFDKGWRAPELLSFEQLQLSI